MCGVWCVVLRASARRAPPPLPASPPHLTTSPCRPLCACCLLQSSVSTSATPAVVAALPGEGRPTARPSPRAACVPGSGPRPSMQTRCRRGRAALRCAARLRCAASACLPGCSSCPALRPDSACLRPPARPQAVDELLAREADPPGERYSLSKVLHTCQVRCSCVRGAKRLVQVACGARRAAPSQEGSSRLSSAASLQPYPFISPALHPPCPPSMDGAAAQGDLHAIFLHYSMLDPGFARHWPPQMTLQVRRRVGACACRLPPPPPQGPPRDVPLDLEPLLCAAGLAGLHERRGQHQPGAWHAHALRQHHPRAPARCLHSL